MFKKMNNKVLLVILAILVAAVLYTELNKKEATFKEILVEVDSAKVTQIDIVSKIPNKAESLITLKKEGDEWKVVSENETHNADKSVVATIISTCNNKLKAQRPIGYRSKWKEYQVDDSLGTHVSVKEGNKVTAQLIIGGMHYEQQPQQNPYAQYGGGMGRQQQMPIITTYVRIKGDSSVFAVNDFLKYTFANDVNNYRNKNLVNVEKEDITQLSFEYPGDSSFVISQHGTQWMIDGVTADSAKVADFVNTISQLKGFTFTDEYTSLPTADINLKIEGNFTPIVVQAVAIPDTLVNYVISSTINAGTKFSGASGLFEKIYKKKSDFEVAFEPMETDLGGAGIEGLEPEEEVESEN